MTKVGVVGTGTVGTVLSDGFLKHGYEVMRGTRDPKRLADWKAKAGPRASVGTFAEAAKFGEMVVLAVKGTAAESAVLLCGVPNLAGKTVIDAMNPLADAPPEKGVLRLSTTWGESLMERLQKIAPEARFVKAFSCVGSALMVDPRFREPDGRVVKPTMFVCGNDASAKAEVEKVLARFGWEWEDMGGVEAARAIEPLAVLWCVPGFQKNEWSHAFRWLKA
jgi:predicted dinucleotide-binding enzyme